MRNRPLTDQEVFAICEQELQASVGSSDSEISHERAEALRRYQGEPRGDEVEGRSDVRTREVLDTVESLMPSLMRIFTDAENLITFEAVGPEDEEQAKQETDTVHHVFWHQNNGYDVIYTLLKDGLLSKTGVVEAEWDDSREERREEYRGLNDQDLVRLMTDPVWEREPVSAEIEEDGYHVVFESRRTEGKVKLTTYPPEDHGVSRGARSPYVKQAPFKYVRGLVSRSSLVEAGYSRDLVDSIPAGTYGDTHEELARRANEANSSSMDTTVYADHVWLTKCWISLDRDGDGIDEDLCCLMGGGSGVEATGNVLLEVVEVDAARLSSWTPVPVTHRYHGLSMADLTMDLEEIQTDILRQQLDNLEQINTARTYGNENVVQEDVLVNQNGAHVRVRGQGDPRAAFGMLPTGSLPPESFAMVEALDERRKQRTGVGADTAALDVGALSNINTGVAALAFDQARSKTELYARNFAEMCLKSLFLDIHELLQKNASKALRVRLRGEWVDVHPSSWSRREDVRPAIGIGAASREKKALALERVMALQEKVLEAGGGGALVAPENLYNTLDDYTELLGLSTQRYWMHPSQAPPPPPPGPDYQVMGLQIQDKVATAQLMRAETDRGETMLKAQETAQRLENQAAEAELARTESGIKMQIEQNAAAEENRDRDADRAQKAREAEAEEERKRLEIVIKADNEAAAREAEMARAMLQSATAIATKSNGEAGPAPLADSFGVVSQLMAQIQASMDEMRAEQAAPRSVVRDANGLIISVGGRQVVRDESGRVVSV